MDGTIFSKFRNSTFRSGNFRKRREPFSNALPHFAVSAIDQLHAALKTVRQLKREIAERKVLRKKCDRNCAGCPFKQRKLMLSNSH